MARLNTQGFEDLAAQQGGVHVSIYMPTHRLGPDTAQGRVRLKNLLRQAEERMVAYGLRAATARQVLEPVAGLVGDSDFWRHQAEGLALFITPGRHWVYQLPRDTDELVIVGDRFHLTPLLPLLSEDGLFHVLALSGNRVRLLRCTRGSVGEVEVPDMPRNFEELNKYIDDTERQLQVHTTTSPGQGQGRAGIFHGHGQSVDDKQLKKWLTDYCHLIEKAVTRYLVPDTAPLLLAAAEPIEAIYRGCNTYPHLLEDKMVGNTDDLNNDDIHKKAWPLVEPHFLASLDRARRTYGDAAGQNAASYDLSDILFAAQDGRVGMLLVASDDHLWGRFDPATGELKVGEHDGPPDEDLINTAVIFTHRTGGQVFAMPEEKMPNNAPVAAVFRY